jgi:hypothetical protein
MRSFLGPAKDIPVNEGGILYQARALTQGSRTVQEAVTVIFNWIVDTFTYDAGRGTPQDGRSVFYSKRGSCVGYTNLAIAMLRSLGIPARYAHGYLPPGYDWGISKKYWGVQISGEGTMPGWKSITRTRAGVSPTSSIPELCRSLPRAAVHGRDQPDPETSREEAPDVEDATTFTIFQEENATLAVDQLPLPKKDFLSRQTGSQQFGTIHGKIKDSSGKSVVKGSLVLWEGIQGKIIPFENGVYSLMGLNDGEYRVTIRAEGYGEVEKNLQARKGEVKQVDLVLPSPGTPQSTPASKTKTAPRTKP